MFACYKTRKSLFYACNATMFLHTISHSHVVSTNQLNRILLISSETERTDNEWTHIPSLRCCWPQCVHIVKCAKQCIDQSIKIALQSVVAVGYIYTLFALHNVSCLAQIETEQNLIELSAHTAKCVRGWLRYSTAATVWYWWIAKFHSIFLNWLVLLPIDRLMISYSKLQTPLILLFHSKNLMEQFLYSDRIWAQRCFCVCSVSVAVAFFEFCRQMRVQLKREGKRRIFSSLFFHFTSVWNTVHMNKKKCRHEDTNQLTF